MKSFEGLRDCNANLKRKVVLVRAMKTCNGSRHTAVLNDKHGAILRLESRIIR